MYRVIILIFSFSFFACNQQRNTNAERHNESTSEQNDFNAFASLFTNGELPFVIDTTFIESLQKKSLNGSAIDSSILKMIGIEEARELYEDRLKYKFFPSKKFKINNYWVLLYYARLNPEIPFDATISKVWIALYNTEGQFSDSMEVGLIDIQFGIEKRIFSTLNAVMIELSIVNSQEDFDSGEVTNESSTKKVTINQGKLN